MDDVVIGVSVATTADVAAFDKVASSAASMGGAVESAANQADAASSKFDSVSASAENMDDKAGRATGALGALSAGFELVGAEKYAGALQGAAMATDFASGAAQAFTLITELESVAKAKAAVVTGVHTAQTIAYTAASKVAAGAQLLLNAALSASPIGLVVLGLTAIAVGLGIAYAKSETFRNVVSGAMDAVKGAVDTVGDAVGDVIDWVKDLPDAFGNAKERVVGAVGDMLTPIQNVIDKVKDLIGWIGDIDFPDIDLNPLNGRAATANVPAYQAPDLVASGLGGGGNQRVVELLTLILAALQGSGAGISDPLAVNQLIRQIGARADRILPT